jgi:hypothetical protein
VWRQCNDAERWVDDIVLQRHSGWNTKNSRRVMVVVFVAVAVDVVIVQ